MLNDSHSILRVSQFISLVNSLLNELPTQVEGEVANFTVSREKFIFFDLKDESEVARLSCFMMTYQLSSPLEDGMRVVVQGQPGLYQKNGQFRLSVTAVEPVGQGSVKRSFDLLKLKLQSEGLFASERKRRLPRFAQQVGIITSVAAAGLGDFKTIAWQRLPGVHYVLANVAVQGNDAVTEICQAFDYLNSHFQLDAIVLIRGGGSMEDLHAYNSEPVARAIVRSKAPVIVGVGHERDITIADFCADVRAATPSNAAQLLVPTLEEVHSMVIHLIGEGKRKVEQAIISNTEKTRYRFETIHNQIVYCIEQCRAKIQAQINTIEAISPQKTLARGYTLTKDSNGKLINSVDQTYQNQLIITTFSHGKTESIIR